MKFAEWLKPYAMVSTEDSHGLALAIAKGWRTYNIVPTAADGKKTGLKQCESIKGIACAFCGKCSGTTNNTAKNDNGRYIVIHGSAKNNHKFR